MINISTFQLPVTVATKAMSSFITSVALMALVNRYTKIETSVDVEELDTFDKDLLIKLIQILGATVVISIIAAMVGNALGNAVNNLAFWTPQDEI